MTLFQLLSSNQFCTGTTQEVIIGVPDDTDIIILDTNLADTPATGSTVHVTDPNLFQAALDAALPGTTITVDPSFVFVGNPDIAPRLPGGNAGEWVIVKTTGSIPAEHSRLQESRVLDNTYTLPKIHCVAGTQGILFHGAGEHKVRFIGFEICPNAGVTFLDTLIAIGTSQESSSAEQPEWVIFDRCYIHGTDSCQIRHGTRLNAKSIGFLDSSLKNFHSNGFDTQAFFGSNGEGPFKLYNCEVEATSENINFGGADPSVLGLNPANLYVAKCLLTKRMTWKDDGIQLIKNLIELKAMDGALIEDCILENCWPHGQLGYTFVFWSVNQSFTNTNVKCQNLTVRNCLIRNVSSIAQYSPSYQDSDGVREGHILKNVKVQNCLVIGLNNAAVSGGGYGFLIQGGVYGLEGIEVSNLTYFLDGGVSTLELITGEGTKFTGLKFNDNLCGGGPHNLHATHAWPVITDDTSEFKNTVLGFVDADYAASILAIPNTGNHYPNDPEIIKLTGGASAAFDPDSVPDDFVLAGDSPYKGAGTGGADIGCNIATLKTHISGVDAS